jgi:ferredoxin
MLAAKRFAVLHPIATTNFLPEVDAEHCNGCGKCVEVCPVEAMGLVTAGDPRKPKRKRARVNEELCLGCGVCVRQCRTGTAKLKPRARRVITPVNTAHRTVLMAIERGKLQELIFDNHALFSHRAMAAILGVILKLPPVKQAMVALPGASADAAPLQSQGHVGARKYRVAPGRMPPKRRSRLRPRGLRESGLCAILQGAQARRHGGGRQRGVFEKNGRNGVAQR